LIVEQDVLRFEIMNKSEFLTPGLLVAFLLLSGCGGDSSNNYSEDRIFEGEAFSLVTSDQGEAWFSVNGDATMVVFGRHSENWSDHTIMETKKQGQNWSIPTVAPFSGTYNDRAGRFYPALDALLFSSDRPVSPEDTTADFNIWVVIHDGEEWLDPEAITSVNSDANDFHASISASGTIYFASNREGGQGRSDLYQAELGIEGYVVQPISGSLNTATSEPDIWIDPEEEYIIFARTDGPGGLGGDDLYISFPEGESWSEPQNLGPEVNTSEYEYAPYVSQDKRILFFTSHTDGDADVMSIPMASLQIEWPE